MNARAVKYPHTRVVPTVFASALPVWGPYSKSKGHGRYSDTRTRWRSCNQ